jgi:hypothetical protein
VEELFQQVITKGGRVAELLQRQADLYADNTKSGDEPLDPMIVAEINGLEEEKKKLGVMQVLKLPMGNHVLDWETLWGIAADWVNDAGIDCWFDLVLHTATLASVEPLTVNHLPCLFPLVYIEKGLPKETAMHCLKMLAQRAPWGAFQFTYIPINLTAKRHWILLRIDWAQQKAEVYNPLKAMTHAITRVSSLSTRTDSPLMRTIANQTNDRRHPGHLSPGG